MDSKTIILDAYLSTLWSDEYINKLTEDILEERISIEKIKERSNFLRKKAEGVLKKYNIPISSLESKGKSLGKNLVKYFEQNKTPKETAKMFSKEISSTVLSIMKPVLAKIEKTGEFAKDRKLLIKIGIAIAVIVTVIIVQGAITIPLYLCLGPAGMIVGAIVLAPLTEEAMKTYFIVSGVPWIGTGIFAGAEALLYIMMMTAQGMTLPVAAFLRAIGVGVHFSTVLVQKYLIKRGEMKAEEASSPSKKRTIDNKALFIGWIAGVAMHAAWNSMAVLTSDDSLFH